MPHRSHRRSSAAPPPLPPTNPASESAADDSVFVTACASNITGKENVLVATSPAESKHQIHELEKLSLTSLGDAAAEDDAAFGSMVAMASKLPPTSIDAQVAFDEMQQSAILTVSNCLPQTIDMCRTRADAFGIRVVIADTKGLDYGGGDVCGVLVQYPRTEGEVRDYADFVKDTHTHGVKVVMATDLLALTTLRPPGEIGANITVSSAQRVGMPMEYGGFEQADPVSYSEEYGLLFGISHSTSTEDGILTTMSILTSTLLHSSPTYALPCASVPILALLSSMSKVHASLGAHQVFEELSSCTDDLFSNRIGFTPALMAYGIEIRVIRAVKPRRSPVGIPVLNTFTSASVSPANNSDQGSDGSSGDPRCCPMCLGRNSIAKAASAVDPAVVNISSMHDMHGWVKEQSIGSGTIIDPDGTILTCVHVVADFQSTKMIVGRKVSVTLQDGREFEGVVLNADRLSDIAVVKIKSMTPLPAARLGLSSQLQPGDWVVALGCPLLLQNTVTAGIVSCVDRESSDLGLGGFRRKYLQTNCLTNCHQLRCTSMPFCQSFFLMLEFQRFLILLSVLPGDLVAIWDIQSQCCSSDEVVFGLDFHQSLYCHLLCGLIYSDEVHPVFSPFAHSLVHAFQTFEEVWEDLCADIRGGVLSEKVTVPSIREAVTKILKPNTELADLIYKKCTGLSNWYGVIPALWPNAKYVYGERLRHCTTESQVLWDPGGSQLLHRLEGKSIFKEGRM